MRQFIIVILLLVVITGFCIEYDDVPFKYKFVYKYVISRDLTYEEYQSLTEIMDIEQLKNEIEENNYKEVLRDNSQKNVVIGIVIFLSLMIGLFFALWGD